MSETAPRDTRTAPADWVSIPVYRSAEDQRMFLANLAAERAKDVTPKDSM